MTKRGRNAFQDNGGTFVVFDDEGDLISGDEDFFINRSDLEGLRRFSNFIIDEIERRKQTRDT